MTSACTRAAYRLRHSGSASRRSDDSGGEPVRVASRSVTGATAAEPGHRRGRRYLRARRGRRRRRCRGRRRSRAPKGSSSARREDVRDDGDQPAGARLRARATSSADVDALVVDVAEHGDALGDVIEAAHGRGLECVIRVRDEDELEEVLELVDPEILLLSAEEAEDGQDAPRAAARAAARHPGRQARDRGARGGEPLGRARAGARRRRRGDRLRQRRGVARR